jgi:predicted small metal-binding protein
MTEIHSLSQLLINFQNEQPTDEISRHFCNVIYYKKYAIFIYNNHKVVNKGEMRMPSYICRDLGMECLFQATGTTDNEIMREFIDHAASAHKMEVLSADVIFKVQNAIKK